MQTAQDNELTADFSLLPSHIWLQVMQLLGLKDRYHVSLTCSLFHQLFRHPSVWRQGHVLLQGWMMNVFQCGCGRPQGSEEDRANFWHCHRVAEKFGHCFCHLSLYVPNCHQEVFHPSTLELYTRLCQSWTLKSLKLRTLSEGHHSNAAPRDCGLRLAMHILKHATGLEQLDIVEWPETSEVLREEDTGLGIDTVLTLADTCPGLKSLNMTWRKHFCSKRHTVSSSPMTALRLVRKFRHLEHLSLHHFMLSENLLQALASGEHCPLGSLTVTCDYEDDRGYSVTPEITQATWVQLTASSPKLEVVLSGTFPDLGFIEWALHPYVPVSSADMLLAHPRNTLLQSGPIPGEAWTTIKASWSGTLQKLTLKNRGWCSAQAADPVDRVLLDLVRSCPRLKHLVFFGKVHCDTIIALAALPRQWRTLQFCVEQITLISRDEDLSLLGHSAWVVAGRQPLLDGLCAIVSRNLGYPWRPIPTYHRPSRVQFLMGRPNCVNPSYSDYVLWPSYNQQCQSNYALPPPCLALPL